MKRVGIAVSKGAQQGQNVFIFATLNPLALSPHPIIPPITAMTLNWPFDSQLRHTSWVAYLQFSSWNLRLDCCQTPPYWPWQDWAAALLSGTLPLTRAVNHSDTRTVAPARADVWFDLRQPAATAAIADLLRVKSADSDAVACANTLCLPSGLLQPRSDWATGKNCDKTVVKVNFGVCCSLAVFLLPWWKRRLFTVCRSHVRVTEGVREGIVDVQSSHQHTQMTLSVSNL